MVKEKIPKYIKGVLLMLVSTVEKTIEQQKKDFIYLLIRDYKYYKEHVSDLKKKRRH